MERFTFKANKLMAKENIKPIGHRILVRYIEKQEQSAGGIILPDTHHKELPNSAEVIDVGAGYVGQDGRIPLPIDVKVGDVILLTKQAGVEVKINNVKHYLVTPEDVLGILY